MQSFLEVRCSGSTWALVDPVQSKLACRRPAGECLVGARRAVSVPSSSRSISIAWPSSRTCACLIHSDLRPLQFGRSSPAPYFMRMPEWWPGVVATGAVRRGSPAAWRAMLRLKALFRA